MEIHVIIFEFDEVEKHLAFAESIAKTFNRANFRTYISFIIIRAISAWIKAPWISSLQMPTVFSLFFGNSYFWNVTLFGMVLFWVFMCFDFWIFSSIVNCFHGLIKKIIHFWFLLTRRFLKYKIFVQIYKNKKKYVLTAKLQSIYNPTLL